MATKAGRNRRQRRVGGSAGARPAAGAGGRARPRGRRRRLNPTVAIAAAVAIGVIALVGLGTLQALKGPGAAAAFDFQAYQGQEHLGGSNVNFADLLDGSRPVVLNFWAGNCPPCRAEMPGLQRVYERHQDEILLVGLDVGVFTGLGTRGSGLALLRELNITYPAGAPPDRTPVVSYSIVSMPTTIFFGADGKVFRRWDGAISERQMEAIIDDMLENA